MDTESAILMLVELSYYLAATLLFTDACMQRKRFGVYSKRSFQDFAASIGLLALERSHFNTCLQRYVLAVPYYQAGVYIYENWRFGNFDPYHWVSWISCILIADFCFYAVHRAMHEINIFWIFHQVHHSSQTYNLVSATRRPVLAVFIDAFILPLCFFFHPRIAFFHWYVNGSVYQFWLHTEFCPRLPWIIEFIFNTPSQHRVHHGVNPYAIDKNYGGFLCIWDRLFGTFAQERDWKEERLQYGLTTPIDASDPISIHLAGPVQLVKKVYMSRGWDKLRVIIYGPGWYPGAKHRLGDVSAHPAPPLKHFTLYTPTVDSRLFTYIKYSSVSAAVSIIFVLVNLRVINLTDFVTESIVFLAMQCTGLILTFRQAVWPVWVELIRVLVTFILLATREHVGYTMAAKYVYMCSYGCGLLYLVWYLVRRLGQSQPDGSHNRTSQHKRPYQYVMQAEE